jgi:hypothetical protein
VSVVPTRAASLTDPSGLEAHGMKNQIQCSVLLPLLAACLVASASDEIPSNHGSLSVKDPTTVNFGVYPAWESRVAHYQLSNSGNSDLEITRTHSTCGCATTGVENKTLGPRQGTTLSVSVLPNSIFGDYKKVTYIHSSDPITPIVPVWVQGRAIPLVSVRPQAFVPAGILKLNAPKAWTFTLQPNRTPVTFSAPQTTSSIPVEVSFTEPTATHTPGMLRIQMPEQKTPARLNVSVTTQATYETNTVPLAISITGLIGPHLVAVPSQLTITPQSAVHHSRVRLHIVAPNQTAARLNANTLSLPKVSGVTFATPTASHVRKGLTIGITCDHAFVQRLQTAKSIPLTFTVPGTAPATVVCKVPTP